MNALIKNNNRDLFKDLFSPFVMNGFPQAWGENGENKMEFIPSANIKETDKEFVITLSLPGLNKEQVEIDVKEDLLTVKGAYAETEEVEGETYHRKEILNGKFQRSFRMGNKVNFSKVEATFNNGLLTITLPKKEEEKVKKIAIK